MMRITQYDGLYGESTTRPDGEYLFSELLETRSRTFDWVIQPHIHARLFQVFFIQSGQFTFQESAGTQQLTGPCLLLIPPTALHGFVYSPDASGRILTLSDSLLDNLFSSSAALLPMLGSIQCLTQFDGVNSSARVGELFRQIDEELFDDQPEKRSMLRAYLQQLFLTFYRIWRHKEAIRTIPDNQAIQYFRQFQQRIRQVGTTHTIAQFADELAITPVHLNRICRQVAGKSAGQLVQEHLLDEARKYLTYTTYSVSEVAYLLAFEYPNYFAKFFRKHTGLSPTEFREQRSQVG